MMATPAAAPPPHRTAVLVVWALLLAAALALIVRTPFTADLSAFLPAAPDARQKLLIEQIHSGLPSRTLLMGITGGDAAGRAQASRTLARALRDSGRFDQVNNGDTDGWAGLGQWLFEHRYALSPAVTPERFTPDGLRSAMAEAMSLLGTPAGDAIKPLLPRDPSGETQRIAESLIPARAPRSEDGVWVARPRPDGTPRALLMATTHAAGADLDGQMAAIATVRQAFLPLQAQGFVLQLSGAPVFSVDSRARIEREVHWLASAGTGTDDKRKKSSSKNVRVNEGSFKALSDIASQNESRTATGITELDRVLGGGIVDGSVVLIGGDPGIGKSTLMLQIAEKLRQKKILYVSGEESAGQIKLRAERLSFGLDNFYILSETNIEIIRAVISREEPDIVVVDSIQTVYVPELESAPGTVSQLRESAAGIIRCAKEDNVSVFIVGHITKEGAIAGPKVLEHMVDVVLQFEGERTHSFRILRGMKNRFGSTNEIGIFEMTDTGLREVLNPSEVFLSQRNYGASGCVISSSIEGSRPILIEVQALVTSSSYGIPQRTSMGFDYKKLNILIAVLEKKLGLFLNKSDIFVNIAGGVRIDEPAIDLAVAMSIYSSLRDIPVDSDTVVLGEIGLSGEIRTIPFVERRITEAAKLGFKRIILPKGNLKNINPTKWKADVIGVEKIKDAIDKIV